MTKPVFETHWPVGKKEAKQEMQRLEHSLDMLRAAVRDTSEYSGNMVWHMLAEAAASQLDWTIEELSEWMEQGD